MVEVKLIARSALAPFIEKGLHGSPDTPANVILREVTDFALASLTAFKGQKTAASNLIKHHFDVELPDASKTATKNGITFISIAPNQWLAFAEHDKANGFVSNLETIIGMVGAVVDQSDARAIIEISGPKARETLAKGVSIDLHPKAFGIEDGATTLAVQLWITLWQIETTPTYRIAVFRAFGSATLEWLIHSAAEFGCFVTE